VSRTSDDTRLERAADIISIEEATRQGTQTDLCQHQQHGNPEEYLRSSQVATVSMMLMVFARGAAR